MIGSRYRGSSALVTGASSGIGEAFARALAAGGADVLLTALADEREALERIASELSAKHSVRTEVVPMDLSAPEGPKSLVEAADRLAFEPRVLVNSAGFGVGGAFAEQSLDRQLAMIQLNVLALVAITGAYLPRMIRRGDGVVVNIASTAALQPLPYFAVYAASKAFVLSFGEALWVEARTAGVRTVTVCSGPVATAFHERAGDTGEATGIKRQMRQRYLTPDAVVDAAFAAVEANRPRAVLRLRGGRVLFGAASVAAAFVPRRWEMLAIERVSRWLWPPE
ncbi:MAG TPA: SDR family NAD(P)-dependent oxidoreductase [Gaiellaceae bacterium]|nr:SDR family NAD(P)-dependent oxidoreductase [Gaiellaceae bacterium]